MRLKQKHSQNTIYMARGQSLRKRSETLRLTEGQGVETKLLIAQDDAICIKARRFSFPYGFQIEVLCVLN